MRLARMTTRRWMIAVAVVAVALGAELTRRRSREFRELARYHAGEGGFYLGHARLWDRARGGGCMELHAGASAEDYALAARWARRCAAHESELSRKYERAAWLPWLPVEPDPPSP
jgi:hypothetical protein